MPSGSGVRRAGVGGIGPTVTGERLARGVCAGPKRTGVAAAVGGLLRAVAALRRTAAQCRAQVVAGRMRDGGSLDAFPDRGAGGLGEWGLAHGNVPSCIGQSVV